MLVNKQQAPSESKAWQKKKKKHHQHQNPTTRKQPRKKNKKTKNTTPWNSLPGVEGGESTSSPNPLICGGKSPIITWVGAAGSRRLKPHEDVRFRPTAATARELRGDPAGLGP